MDDVRTFGKRLHQIELIFSRLTSFLVVYSGLGATVVLIAMIFSTATMSCQERAQKVLFRVPLSDKAPLRSNPTSVLQQMFDPKGLKNAPLTVDMHNNHSGTFMPVGYDLIEVDTATKWLERRGFRLAEMTRQVSQKRHFNGSLARGESKSEYTYILLRSLPHLCAPSPGVDTVPSYNVDNDNYREEIHADITGTNSRRFTMISTLTTFRHRPLKTVKDLLALYPGFRAGGLIGDEQDHVHVTFTQELKARTLRNHELRHAAHVSTKDGETTGVDVTLVVEEGGNGQLTFLASEYEAHAVAKLHRLVMERVSSLGWLARCDNKQQNVLCNVWPHLR